MPSANQIWYDTMNPIFRKHGFTLWGYGDTIGLGKAWFSHNIAGASPIQDKHGWYTQGAIQTPRILGSGGMKMMWEWSITGSPTTPRGGITQDASKALSFLRFIVDTQPDVRIMDAKLQSNFVSDLAKAENERIIKENLAFEKSRTTIEEKLISEHETITYHTVTPLGEALDLLGNTINKISHYQKLELTFDQVTQLETVGYTIRPVSEISFENFIAQFDKPVAYFDNPDTIINESQTVINEKPITIFTDGSTSDENSGVFDTRVAENELKQRIRNAIEDQLSIRENQILDPNINANSSNLTIDEINFIRDNQDLVEQFQKTLQKPKDETKINLNNAENILDDFIAWLRRFLN